MADLQAYSCDAISGQQIERIPVSAFTYSRMLSAGDSGSSATVPIDGTFTQSELEDLLCPWSRILVLERNGVVDYAGYVTSPPEYQRGSALLKVACSDIWGILARRGAWDHGAPNVELWSTTVTGSLAHHAAAAIIRGRDGGPPAPSMGIPVTVPAQSGSSVTRKYFGYHLDMVSDIISDLMYEGIDVYFRPRWINTGDVDWLFHAGPAWSSGVTREFTPTAELSDVSKFTIKGDASRVTNNARYVGEGSEQDMLVRSQRDVGSPYPLLDRVTQAKNVSDTAQLSALAGQDLLTFGAPTSQWEFDVTADTPVDVGDTVILVFDGDLWIPDGSYARRVIGIKGDLGDHKTVLVQPTGGA